MIIQVLYFAEFKDITGKEKEEFDVSGDNLQGLLNLLFEKYNLENLIWDEKIQKIHDLISIIINNQTVQEKNPLLIRLKNGDKVAFLLPVSGG
ncbi:MAG: MoaD/ThiS family protein [Promethearchaeota archaeon]